MAEYIKLGTVSAAFYNARIAGRISPQEYGAAMLILSRLEPDNGVRPAESTIYKFDGCTVPRCVNCHCAINTDWSYCPGCGALIDYDAPECGDRAED